MMLCHWVSSSSCFKRSKCLHCHLEMLDLQYEGAVILQNLVRHCHISQDLIINGLCLFSHSDGRVSEGTIALIHRLLVLEPQERMTASEVLDSLSVVIASSKLGSNPDRLLQV